jgi:hypothetical protein
MSFRNFRIRAASFIAYCIAYQLDFRKKKKPVKKELTTFPTGLVALS